MSDTDDEVEVKGMRQSDGPSFKSPVQSGSRDATGENCSSGNGSSSSASSHTVKAVATRQRQVDRKVCPLRLDPRQAQVLADAACLEEKRVLHNGGTCMLRTVCTALSDVVSALRSKY